MQMKIWGEQTSHAHSFLLNASPNPLQQNENGKAPLVIFTSSNSTIARNAKNSWYYRVSKAVGFIVQLAAAVSLDLLN